MSQETDNNFKRFFHEKHFSLICKRPERGFTVCEIYLKIILEKYTTHINLALAIDINLNLLEFEKMERLGVLHI